jgi:acylphosphatase
MRSVRVVVRGDVQGVGYRYTLRIVARDAAVHGWVRNRRDGSVEAHLEGDADSVDDVLAWMAAGPPGAVVAAADVIEADPTGAAGFDVAPTA